MMDNRFMKGLLAENPLLRLGLGICPALAVTTYAAPALGMGVATACALVCATIVSFLLGRITNENGRVALFLMVSALFAGLTDLVLKGWFPALRESLGIFVPLIAVNCLLLSRAEFANENGFGATLADAIGMGLGYICAMTIVGIVRELLGHGSVFGAEVGFIAASPVVLAALPAGGFIVLGLLMGIFNAILDRKHGKEETQHE